MSTLHCQRIVPLEKQRPQRGKEVNERGNLKHIILYKMFINTTRFEA